MPQKIHWHSEEIKNKIFPDIGFKVDAGMYYHLQGKYSDGFIIYNDGAVINNHIAVYAKLDDTILTLKDDDSIYNNVENRIIGKLNRAGFTIGQVNFNVKKLRRLFFDKSADFDLRLEVSDPLNDLMAFMNIYRTNKKWYKSLYAEELTGTTEAKHSDSATLIITVFFYFYAEIQSQNKG